MVTLKQLNTEKKYRRMSLQGLAGFMNFSPDFDIDSYNKLPGEYSLDKAKLLKKKWARLGKESDK